MGARTSAPRGRLLPPDRARLPVGLPKLGRSVSPETPVIPAGDAGDGRQLSRRDLGGLEARYVAAAHRSYRQGSPTDRHIDPTDDEIVVLALRRGRRSKPGRQASSTGLASPARERLVSACGKDLTGLRNAAMLSIGYDTLCRRSELVALRAEDIEPRPSGAPTSWSGVPRLPLMGWGEPQQFLQRRSPGFKSS